MQPTLFIGLGGTGIHIATKLYTNLLDDANTADNVDSTFQIVCIDTYNRFTEDQNLQLPARYIQNIGFYALPFLDHACLSDENLQKWFDCELRDSLLPLHFDLALGQTMNRQLGRLCLYHDLAGMNYSSVKHSIRLGLQTIHNRSTAPPLIVICASLIGGTGSAIALDISYLVCNILLSIRSTAYILGVFTLDNVYASVLSFAPYNYRTKFILHQVAALKEIQYLANTKYEFGPQGNILTFDCVEPFDSYWLIGGDRSSVERKRPIEIFSLIASELFDVMLSSFSIKGSSKNWALPPIAHHLVRIDGDKNLEYVNMSAPLTFEEIDGWAIYEEEYNKYRRNPDELSPHISIEFG